MAPTIKQRVVAWAHGKLRQQVGTGQCWDLLDRALRHAGAQSSTTVGKDDDYVWGTPVRLEDVTPGDVLQFRDSVITTTTVTIVRLPGGGGSRDTKEIIARRPHHGAIVERVDGGGTLRVLEQHVKPLGDRVQLHSIATHNSTISKTANQMVKDSSGPKAMASVTTITTVSVAGRIWAYRPKPR